MQKSALTFENSVQIINEMFEEIRKGQGQVAATNDEVTNENQVETDNNTNENKVHPENLQIKHKYEISIDKKIIEHNEEHEESTQKVNITTIIHQELPEIQIIQDLNEIQEAFKKYYHEKLDNLTFPIDFTNYFTILSEFYDENSYYHSNPHEFQSYWLQYLKSNIEPSLILEGTKIFMIDGEIWSNNSIDFDLYFQILKKFLCENPLLIYRKKVKRREKNLDKIQKVLQKIFVYYCRKLRKNETFQQNQEDNLTMSLNSFSLFLKDFKVSSKKMSIQKIVELYKKHSNSAQELNFENFNSLLKVLSQNLFCVNGNSEDENFQELLKYLELNDLEKLQEKIPNIKQILTTGSSKKLDVNSKIKAFISNSSIKKDLSEDVKLETKEEQILRNKVSKKLDFKKIPQSHLKFKDSYMINQAKSFINKANLKKEMTFKKLEDLSAANLKAFQDQPFNPEEMFDKNTGDDDLYLAEYSLNPKEKILKSQASPLKIFNERKGEKIQIIKAPIFQKSRSKSPPRQNVFERSPKSRKDQPELMRSPLPDVKKPDYKEKLLERAKKIDLESKEKENQIINKLMDYHNYKINQGLKVLKTKL